MSDLTTRFRNKVNDYMSQYENFWVINYQWNSMENCKQFVMYFLCILFGFIFGMMAIKGLLADNDTPYKFIRNYFVIVFGEISAHTALGITDDTIDSNKVKHIHKICGYVIVITLGVIVLPLSMVGAFFSMLIEDIRHNAPKQNDKSKLIIVDVIIDNFVQMIPVLVMLIIKLVTGIDYKDDVYASNLYVYVILGCTVSLVETIKKDDLSRKGTKWTIYAMCMLLCFSSVLYCLTLVYPYFDIKYITDTNRLIEYLLMLSLGLSFIYIIVEIWRSYAEGIEIEQ